MPISLKNVKDDRPLFITLMKVFSLAQLASAAVLFMLEAWKSAFLMILAVWALIFLLIGSNKAENRAARVVVRVAYLLPLAATLALIAMQTVPLLSQLRGQEDVGDALGQIGIYTLYQLCLIGLTVLLFMLPIMAFTACAGHRFDNNALRICSIFAFLLTIGTAFFFQQLRILDCLYFGSDYILNATIALGFGNVYFRWLCCAIAAGTVIVSFATFPIKCRLFRSLKARKENNASADSSR